MRRNQIITTLTLTLLLAGWIGAEENAEPKLGPIALPELELPELSTTLESETTQIDEPSESLARLVVRDFKNLFTRTESAVIVGVGASAAWAANQFDDRVATGSLNSESGGSPTLDKLFESGELAGDGYVQIGGAVATYGLGKLFRQSAVTELGRDLVRAQLLTGVMTVSIKTAAGRTRPDGGSQTSFPSGHTSSSFATATVLQRRYGWGVGIPSYAFAGYVAASRINENRHFLSDVIFGAALGILGGRTVTVDLVSERFALSPLVVPGGGGVQLTWVGGGAR